MSLTGIKIYGHESSKIHIRNSGIDRAYMARRLNTGHCVKGNIRCNNNSGNVGDVQN